MDNITNKEVRTPLTPGSRLKIIEEDYGNEHFLEISSEVGRGASCIVYNARLRKVINGNEHFVKVIVKEFYPIGLGIKREMNTDSLIIPEESRVGFASLRDTFAEGQTRYSKYYEYVIDHTLPRIFIYGCGNGTVYGVSDPGNGMLLSKIERKELKLEKIASVMEGVCKAIRPFHTKELLYLDCKCDNFFFYSDKATIRSNVYLFDFDTVTSLKDIKGGLNVFCPYSPGWAAPEQVPSELDGRYVDPSLIGYHTDIYSVGVLFFWLLTGRIPSEEDKRLIVEKTFDWRSKSTVCTGAETDVISFISELEGNTLEPDPVIRREKYKQYIAIRDLEKQFGILYGLTVGDNAHFEPIHERLTKLQNDLDDKYEKINNAHEHLEESVKKNSVQTVLFGTKKRIIATVCIFAAAAVAAGFLIRIGINSAENVIPDEVTAQDIGHVKEELLDNHVVFELSNADHDYKTGLENWRRLDYNRAERDISTAYERISNVSTKGDADPAKINNSLGCLYLDMGKYQKAYDHLNDAYVSFCELYGEASPEALSARFSMAQYDYLKGDPTSSQKMIQYILDSRGASVQDTGSNTDTAVGDDTPLTAATLSFKAKIYKDLGEYDKALSTYDEVLGLYGDILKDGKLTEEFVKLTTDSGLTQNKRDEHAAGIVNALSALCEQGDALTATGEYERAREILENAVNIAEENIYIGRKHLLTSKLYMNLAKVCGAQGSLKEAIQHIDSAMRIQKNLFDYEAVYPGLVEVYDIYGDLLMQLQGESGYDYYDSAYKLAIDSFGENHPKTAEAVYHMGKYYADTGVLPEAFRYFKRAVEIRKNLLGYDHESTVRYLYALAEAQKKNGDESEAEQSIAEAEEIIEKIGMKVLH